VKNEHEVRTMVVRVRQRAQKLVIVDSVSLFSVGIAGSDPIGELQRESPDQIVPFVVLHDLAGWTSDERGFNVV